jgi:adenylyl-sulfate kinase
MKNKQAFTVWLTGLSGAGKTSLGTNLKKHLDASSFPSCIIDGDILRSGLSKDLNFEIDSRTENIRRAAEISRILNGNQIVSIVSMISPLANQRMNAKNIIGESLFFEVHVATDIKVCEARDTKGYYKSARLGGLTNFTGLSADYEEPVNPALKIDAGVLTLEESTQLLIEKLTVTFAI